jgi:DNA-binding transcriptional LysR family regulator
VTTGATWRLELADKIVEVPVAFALSTNNHLALILAACLDSGIIHIPEICIAGELARKHLQIIPGCTDPEPYGVYAVYPHRNAATKVKVLVDFIDSMLAKAATLDRWMPLASRETGLPKSQNHETQHRQKTNVA